MAEYGDCFPPLFPFYPPFDPAMLPPWLRLMSELGRWNLTVSLGSGYRPALLLLVAGSKFLLLQVGTTGPSRRGQGRAHVTGGIPLPRTSSGLLVAYTGIIHVGSVACTTSFRWYSILRIKALV